ncbi:MAG: glycosyltransferase [Parvularculaceae bacterium]
MADDPPSRLTPLRQSARTPACSSRQDTTQVNSVAIVTMVQLKDLPWAYSSLQSLRQLRGEGLFRLVLINDACDPETAARIEAAVDGVVISDGRNLGVAGGRNRLVREAAARGAKFILSIDDDILLPEDFAETLWAEYKALEEAGASPGILTPATLDFHAVKGALYDAYALAPLENGGAIATPSTAEVRSRLASFEGFDNAAIYHMGIRDWHGAYCFTSGEADNAIQQAYQIEPARFHGAQAGLKASLEAKPAILNGADPIPIDTAPGGICLYSIALFEEVGGICESFNPFGYEDADFALRASEHGYRHFCAPRAIAIHDIAARLSERPLPVLMAAQGKMAGALTSRHLAGGEAAGSFIAIARRLFTSLGAKKPIGREAGFEFLSLRRLSCLLAFSSNALVFGLPDASAKAAPSAAACAELLKNLVSAIYKPCTDLSVAVEGARVVARSGDREETLFDGEVRASGEETTIDIAAMRLSSPRELVPPLLRTLSASGGGPAILSGRFVLGAGGAFRLEGVKLATESGFMLTANGEGVRPARPEHAVAPIRIERLSLLIEDLGALPRLLAFLSDMDERSPRDYVGALQSAYAQPGLSTLFDWLTGASNMLTVEVSGVLDGAPEPPSLEVVCKPAPAGAVRNVKVARLMTDPALAARARSPMTAVRAKVKRTIDTVARLVGEDPKVAPFPDAYNPSTLTRLSWKARYIAASRGIALTGNEARILQYKDSGRGKRAFIIGNGPSLNQLDLTKLKDEATFGVNAIYLNKDSMGFLPTHYIVEDVFVAEDRAGEINALKGPTKWFGNYLRYCLDGGPDACWMNVACDYRNYPNFPNFSRNAARIVWVGGTVSYVAMQLAYFMGYDPVYIIGFDHSYSVPKDAQVEGRAITSTSDDPNHFHPDYFGKGYRWHDPRVDRMEVAYGRAREAYEAAGRRIYNATAGGKLEVFERVAYDSLFRTGNT